MHGDLTRYGTILGTTRYMAPEQAYGKKCSAQSDIYSFCIVLHEALSGHRPIAGRARKGDGTFHEPRERHPKVPRWIWKILSQGLALDARKRPSSIQAFLDQLIHAVARRKRIRTHLRGWTPALLGAATFFGVIGQLTAKAPRVDCDARANAIEQLWNHDRKQALLQRFTLASDRLGPQCWKTVERQLGLWIEQWKDAALTQCRVAHPEGQTVVLPETNAPAASSDTSNK